MEQEHIHKKNWMRGLKNGMEIKYLEGALSDLNNITDYYFNRFGYESAKKVYSQIRETIQRLESFPGSGLPSKDRLLKKLGYREIYSGRFVAVYRIDMDQKIIFINHFADTQMDYPNLFKEKERDD